MAPSLPLPLYKWGMPLYEDAKREIRANLEQISIGNRVRAVAIGFLTNDQLALINANQANLGLHPIDPEILFVGGHIHERRMLTDRYTIDDVLDQIESAMHRDADIVAESKLTAIENPTRRQDRYGNWVLDRGVFKIQKVKHGRPELFSVIPKGDVNKPA